MTKTPGKINKTNQLLQLLQLLHLQYLRHVDCDAADHCKRNTYTSKGSLHPYTPTATLTPLLLTRTTLTPRLLTRTTLTPLLLTTYPTPHGAIPTWPLGGYIHPGREAMYDSRITQTYLNRRMTTELSRLSNNVLLQR